MIFGNIFAIKKKKKNVLKNNVYLEKFGQRVFLCIKLNIFDDGILFSQLAAKMYGGRL